MAYVFACEFPEDLWYHVDTDVWLRILSDGTAHIGMTDPAVTRSGKILHVNVRVGKRVETGRNVATMESGKWVGPLLAPVPGVVLAANREVLSDPGLINRAPYERGWLAHFHPTVGSDAFHRYGLFHGEDALEPYGLRIRSLGLTCIRCAELE